MIGTARPGLDLMTRSIALFVSTVSTMLFVHPCQMAPRTRFNMLLHCVIRISPLGPGGPSVEDADISESTDANAPGDAIVMSAGYRLDCWLVNCFELLCGIGEYDVSSICAHSALFDRDLLPLTLSDMGGSGCCGWLQFVTLGAGPVAPPINMRERTVMLGEVGWCMSGLHTLSRDHWKSCR